MSIAADVLIVLIALLHVAILVVEMFLWERPIGMRAFGFTPERAAITRVMAANQGLYNGFLAAGLFWAVFLGNDGRGVAGFFLSCVLAAGLFGAATASKRILFVQALPAALALVLLLVDRRP